MPEYEFELERSDYYQKRASLLKSNGIPKLSDAKINLGDPLSNVVFKECEEALKEDFGLKEPLKGPGDTLWVSPSDLLLGKIALKPPLTFKCLQALTHKGILEIGQGLEDRFRMEMELDKQKALEKLRTELSATMEDRMKLQIKEVEIRERVACHVEMQNQQQQFEINLKEELDKLEQNIHEQYEQIMANHDAELKSKWEDQLQAEVNKTVDAMTMEYLKQLEKQERKLTELFKMELKKQQFLRHFDEQYYKHKTTEALRQLKHNLECTNLVNMMYVLCTERQKCCDQKVAIENRYKTEIGDLEEQMKQKCEVLEKVKAEKEEQIKNVTVRETCLIEVLKQFQKFINFALKSAPAQAEFLLSVEKMMVFELTKEITKSEMKPVKRKEAPAIMAWKYESSTSSLKSSGMTIKDHHDCLKELNPPLKAELDENDTLPAIYFKNKTYIREDFRDMLAANVPLTPSNELWNRGIELLIQNWRQSTQNLKKSVDSEKEISAEKFDDFGGSDRRRSNKSAVQFTDESNTAKSARISLDSKKTKSSLKPSSFRCLEDVQFKPFESSSRILAAKDSLELLELQRKTDSIHIPPDSTFEYENLRQELEVPVTPPAETGSRITSGKELVIDVKDSVILRMSEFAKTQSSREFAVSPKDSIEVAKEGMKDKDLISQMSKLSCARDSVEILRESLQKLKTPPNMCQKKDNKISEPSNERTLFGSSRSCCDKCRRKDEDFISDDERSVKISRIQIINLDDRFRTPSLVSFKNEPVFYKDAPMERVKSTPTVKSTITSSKTKRKSRKPSKKVTQAQAKVVGDLNAREGSQTTDEFTADRIHSLVKLMGEQPQLMRLFTAGIQ